MDGPGKKVENPIGIMQGRLTSRYMGRYQAYPADSWEEEFYLAKDMGFECIEFIFDYENFDQHPLMTLDGREKLNELIKTTGVKIYSICADYFMKFPLFVDNETSRHENVETLINLIKNTSLVGGMDITIPCVDESALKNEKHKALLKKSLDQCLEASLLHGVNINLETDLSPMDIQGLLTDINHPKIKVNYDTGNSASAGYDPEEELSAYGEYISVLHIKDRLLNGGSVQLGTGQADFEKIFRKLNKRSFRGVIIMQAARAAESDDEIGFVKEQLNFLNSCLEKWFN